MKISMKLWHRSVWHHACSMLEICYGENIWQCSWFEISLNAFLWSTILQRQVLIIIKLFFISFHTFWNELCSCVILTFSEGFFVLSCYMVSLCALTVNRFKFLYSQPYPQQRLFQKIILSGNPQCR